MDRALGGGKTEYLPRGMSSYAELLRQCHRDARTELTRRLGADTAKWTWSVYAPVRFPHPLASVPLIGGQFAFAPIVAGGTGGLLGASPNVGASVSMRFIADTSDWDASQQGITLGQSGDPESPHWKDQLADWRAATPALFPFTPATVERAKTNMLVMRPANR
jgi:penicillin amidase